MTVGTTEYVSVYGQPAFLTHRHGTGNIYQASDTPEKYISPHKLWSDTFLVDISDSEEDNHSTQCRRDAYVNELTQHLVQIMRWVWTRIVRWRTNIMLLCIVSFAVYVVIFDGSAQPNIPEDAIDLEELEQEIEIGNAVRLVTYKSPMDEKIYAIPIPNNSKYSRDFVHEAQLSRTLKFNRLWTWADDAIRHVELFPEQQEVDEIITALHTAKIVNVDVLSIGKYESGTSDKWLLTLEGGQKALLKIVWEEKGTMKISALCNYGYEMPTAEIAAFHLHRLLGFRNTPYATGRVINLQWDILPVASPSVLKQISRNAGNETCVVGKCYFCKTKRKLCPPSGDIEASLVYWVPRKMKLHTFPPKYMPYSTPSMDVWGKLSFNNRSYCSKIRKIEPYEQDYYYYDLFDFAVLDTLMYHFDTKHYTIDDHSSAQGSTVRLDHGRAFCANDRDDEQIFMAPLVQCCTLRKSTWGKITANKDGLLSRKLRQRLERDPIAPVLEEKWYPVLERRLKLIIAAVERCAEANGGMEHVLVEG